MAMLRPFAIVIGCALAWAGLPVREAASVRQATFRARTDVVLVNASVKQGREPVRNLTAGDFGLTDNGVEQTVDALSLERVPLDLTVVMTGYLVGHRENSAAYFRGLTDASKVRQSLLPEDRVRVVWVHAEIRGGLVGKEESLFAEDASVPRYLGVSLVDGLFYAMAWPVEPDRRHLVVAFTDGLDRYSTVEIETLPALAAHSDAVLHAVFWANPADGPGANGEFAAGGWGSTGSPSEWKASYESVSEAVRRTGGTVHKATNALEDLVTIIEDFRSSYVLQYTPRGVPADGWHEVHVRVTRPGRFDVRSRKGYEIRR